MHRRTSATCIVLIAAAFLTGHVGTSDVIYDGSAGPYPLRVVVRPAGVVPGLAEIAVRVLAGNPDGVSVQAAPASLGTSASPRPERMQAVAGEARLYSADLWLMTSGAYLVRIAVSGREGEGELVLPVSSIATRRLGMTREVGWVLLAFGALLVAGALTIARAALRDAVMLPGEPPGEPERRAGRVAFATSAVVLGMVLAGGWRWWRSEDGAYARTVERPLAVRGSVSNDSNRAVLRLVVTDSAWQGDRLLPDHGKIMHLFVVQDGSLAAFAHLHPSREDARTFAAQIPSLPAGRYRAFGDVVHENGFARTLIATVEIPPGTGRAALIGSDDSWQLAGPIAATPPSGGPVASALVGGGSMTWERAGSLVAGPELSIRVLVRDAKGQPTTIEPYMGMRGHAVVMRDSGDVFVHLHPAGTISMGAQRYMEEREQLITPHGLPESDEAGVVKFPFAFPKPGRYRVWVQVKIKGEVRTGVFDTTVEPRR